MAIKYETKAQSGDKVTVVNPFNFADRFVGNVGDEWVVTSKSEDFVRLQKGDARFSLNISSFVRHFEK